MPPTSTVRKLEDKAVQGLPGGTGWWWGMIFQGFVQVPGGQQACTHAMGGRWHLFESDEEETITSRKPLTPFLNCCLPLAEKQTTQTEATEPWKCKFYWHCPEYPELSSEKQMF